MSKTIRKADGTFNGSIGDGKSKVPTPATSKSARKLFGNQQPVGRTKTPEQALYWEQMTLFQKDKTAFAEFVLEEAKTKNVVLFPAQMKGAQSMGELFSELSKKGYVPVSISLDSYSGEFSATKTTSTEQMNSLTPEQKFEREEFFGKVVVEHLNKFPTLPVTGLIFDNGFVTKSFILRVAKGRLVVVKPYYPGNLVEG